MQLGIPFIVIFPRAAREPAHINLLKPSGNFTYHQV
jgi:hypothetical protein